MQDGSLRSYSRRSQFGPGAQNVPFIQLSEAALLWWWWESQTELNFSSLGQR